MKSISASSQGLLLGFIAYFVWSCGDALYKLASEQGATPYLTMVFGSAFSTSVILLKMAAQKRLVELKPKAPLLVIGRGLNNLGLCYCLYLLRSFADCQRLRY